MAPSPARCTAQVFAAPRVAWFLAAGEAVRQQSPVDHERWAPDLKTLLLNSRDPQTTGYNRLRFEPVRYILRQITSSNPGTNE